MIGVVQIKWIYMASFMAQSDNLQKEQLFLRLHNNQFLLQLEVTPHEIMCIKIVSQCTVITKNEHIMIDVVQIKWIQMTSFMAQSENLYEEKLFLQSHSN